MTVLAHHEDLDGAVVPGGVLPLAQRHDRHGVVVNHGLAAHRLLSLGQDELLIINGADRSAPDPFVRTNRPAGFTGVSRPDGAHRPSSPVCDASASGSPGRWEA